MADQSELTEPRTSLLDGIETVDELLALQAAVEEKLAREREKIEALASALGGSCSFKNGPDKKKGKSRNANKEQ
jgi:hypothetical protein